MENYLKSELYKLIREDDSIFNFLHESTLDGLWYRDLENPENEWMDNRFWTTLGYNPDEMQNKPGAWKDIINKDDLELASGNFNKHIESPNHPYDQLVRYKHKNGKTIWIRCRGLIIRNTDGKAIRLLGTHHDVTALKEIEESLKKKEEKYRLIVQSISDVIWVYNVTRDKFTYISPSVYNLRGYRAEEAMRMKLNQSLTPDSEKKARELIKLQVQEFIETKDERKCYLHEFQQPCKNGETIWIEASAHYRYNSEQEIEAVGISRDISERKKMEEQLTESENKYRTLFEKSLDPIALMKGEIFIDCNQALLDVLKFKSKDSVIDKKPWHISPELQSDGTPSKQKALENLSVAYSEGYKEFDWVHSDSNNNPKWLHVSLAKMVIKNEDLLFVIYRDITRQKQFERKLIESRKATEENEKRFKNLFFNSNTAVFLLDHSGTIIDCNNAAISLFKYGRDELINKKPWKFSPEYQPDGTRSDDLGVINNLLGKGLTQHHNFNWVHQDSTGKIFYTEIKLSPITLSQKQYIYAYIRDASYEKFLQRSEAELKKANQDKSRFFSVLAHDLSGTIGNNYSIIKVLNDNSIDPTDREELTYYLYENTTKAYNLLTDLIKWGKATMNQDAFVPVEIFLFELIKSVNDYYRPKLSQKKINLMIECPKELKIMTDNNQLETILRNLIGNAIKFTPDGGKINCNCFTGDNRLNMQIKDNGIGMPKEKAEQLFTLEGIESTKGTNGESGSGLGLQIVKEYVLRLKGQISATSEPGKGMTFNVELPLNPDKSF